MAPAEAAGAVAQTLAAAALDISSLTVVYIHGIGNKPAPAILKRQYDQALFGVDMGSRSRLAYWADLQYPQPLPAGEVEGLSVPQPQAYHARATAESDARTVEAAVGETPYGRAAEQYARAVAAKLMRTARPPRTQPLGVGTRILPEPIRRPVVEWITKTFVRDTAAYFFDAAKRREMQDRIRTILRAGRGPYVIVAHSQGSIIAYDVLCEFGQGDAPFEVPLLVTVGSPLGIDEVQDHLRKPLVVPRLVGEWWNFADLIDPVALDKTLADEFEAPVSLEDRIVVNRDTLRISGFNPHSGTGYLRTDAVQETVRARLPAGFVSPLAPFVIARDVAAEIADPRVRFPVLIELKSADPAGPLAVTGDLLERELQQMERTAAAREGAPVGGLFRIDRLRRYISAELNAEEVYGLAARHQELQIETVWKNTVKRALLDRSTDVVQARTAQRGYGATGKGIAWAVLDTGIVPTHPHFAARAEPPVQEATIAAQWDCTPPGRPVRRELRDPDGHGTHVAGIIAGRGKGENGRYEAIAPDAKLHIYKVLDEQGSGQDSWIIKALDHIAEVNEGSADLVIHGVNVSLGGPFDEAVFGCGFSPICRELRRLWRQGVLVCIAAGNEGHLVIDTVEGEQKLTLDLSIGDPANLEEAIAVGSVHRTSPHLYGISYFSSRGPTADGRAKPDVVAPGEKITSCNGRFKPNKPQTEYISLSGTSMACPHVSGMLAAFLSVRREFIGNPDRVKEILMAHATDLRRDRYHQGAGLPNLVKMLMET